MILRATILRSYVPGLCRRFSLFFVSFFTLTSFSATLNCKDIILRSAEQMKHPSSQDVFYKNNPKLDKQITISQTPTHPTLKPNPNAVAGGKKPNPDNFSGPRKKRAIELEIESANALQKAGYKTEHLEEVLGGNGHGSDLDSGNVRTINKSNPDLSVEGRPFDVFSPTSKNELNLRSVSDKLKHQSPRLVINLDRVPSVDPAELTNKIPHESGPNRKLTGAQEIIIIKDGKIYDHFVRKEGAKELISLTNPKTSASTAPPSARKATSRASEKYFTPEMDKAWRRGLSDSTQQDMDNRLRQFDFAGGHIEFGSSRGRSYVNSKGEPVIRLPEAARNDPELLARELGHELDHFSRRDRSVMSIAKAKANALKLKKPTPEIIKEVRSKMPEGSAGDLAALEESATQFQQKIAQEQNSSKGQTTKDNNSWDNTYAARQDIQRLSQEMASAAPAETRQIQRKVSIQMDKIVTSDAFKEHFPGDTPITEAGLKSFFNKAFPDAKGSGNAEYLRGQFLQSSRVKVGNRFEGDLVKEIDQNFSPAKLLLVIENSRKSRDPASPKVFPLNSPIHVSKQTVLDASPAQKVLGESQEAFKNFALELEGENGIAPPISSIKPSEAKRLSKQMGWDVLPQQEIILKNFENDIGRVDALRGATPKNSPSPLTIKPKVSKEERLSRVKGGDNKELAFYNTQTLEAQTADGSRYEITTIPITSGRYKGAYSVEVTSFAAGREPHTIPLGYNSGLANKIRFYNGHALKKAAGKGELSEADIKDFSDQLGEQVRLLLINDYKSKLTSLESQAETLLQDSRNLQNQLNNRAEK